MKETISVIIPAHNAAEYLAEALDSVFAQTVTCPLEVVVYDDGSSDGTSQVLAHYGKPLQCLGGASSKGANHARNQAVIASTGAYLAFLDADDVWLPDKLAQQISLLRQSDGPALVFGQAQEFDENGPRGKFRGCCLTSLCLTTRAVFDRVGPFDEELRLGDFAEWLSRAQDLGVKLLSPEIPVARRRHHADNSGRRLKDHRADYLEVVRRRLARRRQAD